jgi:anti-anti-sigma regulatory factor
MKHKSAILSEDMYHRVYRLMNRDTDPRLIAAALHLPLRTVLNIIARLKRSKPHEAFPSPAAELEIEEQGSGSFLDVYFLAKTRYAILQLVGYCTREMATVLETELLKVQTSVWKAIAIRMTDVNELDEWTAKRLLDFCTALKARERYVAILDPAPAIETVIARAGFEGAVPIFGTERAFEEEAFARRGSQNQVRSRRSP